jgi:hypothetical protein
VWIVVLTRSSRCESSNSRNDSKCALDQLRAASPASAQANLMYAFMNEAVGLGKKKIVMQWIPAHVATSPKFWTFGS